MIVVLKEGASERKMDGTKDDISSGVTSEIRVTFNGEKDMIFGLSDAPLRPAFEIKLILPMVE